MPYPYSVVEGGSSTTTALPAAAAAEGAHARPKTLVLLIDEPGIMRDGLCGLLESDGTIEVVAASANRRDAIEALDIVQPHVAIIDFSTDLKGGPETIAHLKRRWPAVRILVLTVRRDEQFIETALRAGADGYVLKSDSRAELFNAVHRIASGKGYKSLGPGSDGDRIRPDLGPAPGAGPATRRADAPRAGSDRADRQGLPHARDGAAHVVESQDGGEAPHQSHAQAGAPIGSGGRGIRHHSRLRLTARPFLRTRPEQREERMLHRRIGRQRFHEARKIRRGLPAPRSVTDVIAQEAHGEYATTAVTGPHTARGMQRQHVKTHRVPRAQLPTQEPVATSVGIDVGQLGKSAFREPPGLCVQE